MSLKPLGFNADPKAHIIQTPCDVKHGGDGEYTFSEISARGATEMPFATIRWQVGPMGDIPNGTTVQDLVRCLIEKMSEYQSKVPSRENAIVITKMEECQMWLATRQATRERRGVRGTMQA